MLFAEYGINSVQMDALIFVAIQSKASKTVCQKDVENYLKLRASSVSTLLSALEKKNLLKRTVSDGDARTKNITLTEDGVLICKKNKLLIEKCDALVQSALSEEEQEQFINYMNKIMAVIDRQEKEIK